MARVKNTIIPKVANSNLNEDENSQDVLRQARAKELFVAIVSPAGAGGGTAATILGDYIKAIKIDENPYEVHHIKASHEIKKWAQEAGVPTPEEGARKSLAGVRQMQDAGDKMRSHFRDNAAVARAVLARIRQIRAEQTGLPLGKVDGKPRAYIIESLRHPAEAQMLRSLYQDAFTLVGVVCDPVERENRLIHELFDMKERHKESTKKQVQNFMERDADAPEKHGQHVIDAFHEADFFVNNSKATKNISITEMNEYLRRLVRLISCGDVVRPTVEETAMHHAHSAQLRSACLSRQVGAALVDATGNIVATGTNEVPRAGGGVYGEAFQEEVQPEDNRCAFREKKFCSSNRAQNEIIEELIAEFPSLLAGQEKQRVMATLRRTRIGGLIEFSRAVHAEMDAILSAARTGVSPRGTRLFVSTFPCHYCARHIVSAGIDEVQYIEPYPKSRALGLHCDSITTDATDWIAPSKQAAKTGSVAVPKVLFRPFIGVAPRMYARVFLKDRDYKDKFTGDFRMGQPDWGGPSEIFKLPYTDLEGELGRM